MKRVLLISLLAILAFAAILIVRFPASWLAGFFPPDVACGELSGTAWDGACSRLAYKGAPAGDLRWELHPAALLRMKVAAFVDLTRGGDFIRGDVVAGRDHSISAKDVQVQMPLERPFFPEMASPFSGTLSLNLANVQLQQDPATKKFTITAVEGQAQATNLYSHRDRVALGAYSATFPKTAPGSEPVGQLTTLEGPVDFTGTIKLTRAPGYEVNGNLRVKPETPAAFRDQLRFFPENPDGTRQVGLEGTF